MQSEVHTLLKTDSGMNFLELKFPPPLQVLLFAIAMWQVSAQFPTMVLPLPANKAIGIVIAGAGLLLLLAGIIALRTARTTVNPLNPGATFALVTTGIFRVSRNPIYLGDLLALTGWATYLSHPLAFLFLPVFVITMNRFQILPEERILSAKFGEAFAEYRQSVRRWL